jgi:isochorismate synthase
LHLRTDIIGEVESSDLLGKLIESLHPTPAVCGLPKETAVQFILENENYKRTYYAGYLGELNMNGNTQLVVNLRCMEIENNKISLFVGGGITKGSIPEKEFEETVTKAMVMKKVL